LAWFAESHNNVVEYLSLKDHRTYHEAKENILNHASNHPSPSRIFYQNSKTQHEAHAVSWLNGKKDKKKKKESSSSCNSGDVECNWCRKHSPSTTSSHIWTLCQECKAQRDRNRAEMLAPYNRYLKSSGEATSNYNTNRR
jgi:hypothetical protein